MKSGKIQKHNYRIDVILKIKQSYWLTPGMRFQILGQHWVKGTYLKEQGLWAIVDIDGKMENIKKSLLIPIDVNDRPILKQSTLTEIEGMSLIDFIRSIDKTKNI